MRASNVSFCPSSLVVVPFSPQWGKFSSLVVTGICSWTVAVVPARMGELWMRFLLRRGGFCKGFMFRRCATHLGPSCKPIIGLREETYRGARTWPRSRNRARARTSDGGLRGRKFFRRESDEDGTNDDGSGGGGFFAMIALNEVGSRVKMSSAARAHRHVQNFSRFKITARAAFPSKRGKKRNCFEYFNAI